MHELSVTRLIAASPAVVWDIMVNRLEEWWCPRPWTTELVAQERRSGGRSAMVMRGPDGESNVLEGIYLAWEDGRRFVTTDAVNADLEPTGPFMVGIWEVAPEGDGTRYTASARHWSAETMQQHREKGFEDGWSACAEQLAELCEAE